MWSLETSKGFEVRKCRERIVEYLHGTVLDFGCGNEKVCFNAVGIDFDSDKAELKLDLSNIKSYRFFGNDIADVVFSSHFLEDIIDYKSVIKEWWRILKPEGHLILYLPHKDFYPNIGQPGANTRHKHDFIPSDIIEAIHECGSNKIVSCETYSDADEYSFLIVAQKLDIPVQLNLNTIVKGEYPEKTVCIVKYGGYGDGLYATPLYRLYKEMGYYVVANIQPDNIPIIENNPFIDEYHIQNKYVIPMTKLGEYFEALKKKYRKVINLCQVVERGLILEERDEELYNLDTFERNKRFNINYYDKIIEASGLHETGLNPELYLTENEQRLGEYFQSKHKGKFKIQWQLTGSSWHKLNPYCDQIIDKLTEKYPDIEVFLTGGDIVRLLAWENKQVFSRIGIWNIRQSMIMTKFMDLVVSPETGILNASGCFDTPKIGLLTHSSKENLTKYFKNDYSIQSEVNCSPCHRLVHDPGKCPLDREFNLPVCQAYGFGLNGEKIFNQIEKIYLKWRK